MREVTRPKSRASEARCYPDLQVRSETPDFQAYRGTGAARFANEAELECAKILDYYGVPWEYEPRTFVLEEDEDGRVVEAFTPDFYLPEQDLYLEVTVMKQSLVTRKNRKLRKLRERYPDVNVKLFYQRDIERLAQRYRLNLAYARRPTRRVGEVYLSREEIAARVARARRRDRRATTRGASRCSSRRSRRASSSSPTSRARSPIPHDARLPRARRLRRRRTGGTRASGCSRTSTPSIDGRRRARRRGRRRHRA